MGNTSSTSPTLIGRKNKNDKLRLLGAVGPAMRALRYNITLVSLGMLMTIAPMAAQIPLEKLFFTGTVPPDDHVSILYWPLLLYIPFYLAGILISIFTILVLADGAHREKEPFTTYARRGMQVFWRVLLGYIVAGLAIILPIIGVAIIIGAYLALATLSNIQALQIIGIVLAIIGGLGVFIWFIITCIRYSLVGLVAMFEPEIPILDTRKRSRQLLEGAGGWFVLKLGLLSTLAAFLVLLPFYVHTFSAIATHTPPQIQPPPAYLQNYLRLASLAFIVLNVLFTAMFVILYLNRRSKRPEFRTAASNRQSWKMAALGVLIAGGTAALLLSIPSLKHRYRLQQQQNQLQQAAQLQAEIENALTIYTNKENGYALKLPKDFVPLSTKPEQGDVFTSQSTETPFSVIVQSLPFDPGLGYVNGQTTDDRRTVVNNSTPSIDNALEQLTGSTDTTIVKGDINIPGTNHKRGFFATVEATDDANQELSLRAIIIPKDDGTSIMVAITGLKQFDQQLKPFVDIIFKSIDLQAK